jgi:hypothetical protein
VIAPPNDPIFRKNVLDSKITVLRVREIYMTLALSTISYNSSTSSLYLSTVSINLISFPLLLQVPILYSCILFPLLNPNLSLAL